MSAERSLVERVDSALQASPHLSRRRVQLEADQGRVVLHGVVDSYFLKQMAQEAVRSVDGVEQIDNRLEVVWN